MNKADTEEVSREPIRRALWCVPAQEGAGCTETRGEELERDGGLSEQNRRRRADSGAGG